MNERSFIVKGSRVFAPLLYSIYGNITRRLPRTFRGARAAPPAVVGSLPATNCRPKHFDKNSDGLGKLPRPTGWQPVLPRMSVCSYVFFVSGLRRISPRL